ncbi:hypothetical protein MKX03_024264 [Papaver bracteatum]|nr:hypothetical protein MKX03_024264 [Papaver bracteatum]
MTSRFHNGHFQTPQIACLQNPKPAVARRYSLLHPIFTSPTAFWRVHDLSTISSDFSCKAASSAGAADYNEQMLGSKKKKKSQRIAGIEQDELLDPVDLADPDSCFCEFRGVQVHYKVAGEEGIDENGANVLSVNQNSSKELVTNQPSKKRFPMVLLHGFGASVFSWDKVLKPLAQCIGSKVIAFDRPAFGLTSRIFNAPNTTNASTQNSSKGSDLQPLNPYSMAFSVLATMYFINLLVAEKIILVGHSAGSLVAVNTYFEAPERVAALILVAPAIAAPLSISQQKDHQETENQANGVGPRSKVGGNPFSQMVNALSKFCTYIALAITGTLKAIAKIANSLFKKALKSILRTSFAAALIRIVIDKFGIAGIKNAWYDGSQVNDNILQGYTKPLKTKGWDKALLEFVVAMLTDSESESKPPLSQRLKDISCPVLIITGDTDRLVPSWNAVRLSRAIPGSHLEVIKNCGHLPQEEKIEDFISIVRKFLQKIDAVPREEEEE